MDRFTLAATAFEKENSFDPTRIADGDRERPREVVQAERLAGWVDRLAPGASVALRLAARCQHLRRWEIPRSTYPAGRIGYLEWRKALSRFHADAASEILRNVGYDDLTIERVRTINQKKSIKQDPDVQTMEDALCLAFLEFEIAEFAGKHPPEKVIDILRKSWGKMSESGHRAALSLTFSDDVRRLVERALSPTPST